MTEENEEQVEAVEESVEKKGLHEAEFPNAGRDNELEAQRQAELDAEREEHQRRTAGENKEPG